MNFTDINENNRVSTNEHRRKNFGCSCRVSSKMKELNLNCSFATQNGKTYFDTGGIGENSDVKRKALKSL